MRRAGTMLLLVLTVACGGGGGTPSGPSTGADSPEAAVEELIAAFAGPDFDSAAPLALPGQAALVQFDFHLHSLAESAATRPDAAHYALAAHRHNCLHQGLHFLPLIEIVQRQYLAQGVRRIGSLHQRQMIERQTRYQPP